MNRVRLSSVFRPVGEDGQPRHGQTDPGRVGHPITDLVRIDGAGGEPRWLTCSWAPLTEGGYVVVARDDTERKKLQDDKDGWIAQVSHELRTPLTPIKGFLHTLQRRDDQFTSADRQRIYEVMLREEQRLEDLVTSLLQATTIDQRGVVVVPEVLDWATIVRAPRTPPQVSLCSHMTNAQRAQAGFARRSEPGGHGGTRGA